MEKIVRVWVWIFVIQWDKVLIWKRKNAHGNGKYWFPGWHLEFWETIEACSSRELFEETSLIAHIKEVETLGFTNDIMEDDQKHYITIFTRITTFSWELENTEPHKVENWEWFTWNEIKWLWDQLFITIQDFIKKYPDFNPTL